MRVLFCGGTKAGSSCLEHLVNTGAEVVGVMSSYDEDDVGVIADGYDLPYFNTFNRAQDAGFDTVLSVYFNRRIPESTLSVAKNKINFHSGKLPEYRGCNINMWMIINGESRGFVTAHTLTPNFDEGEILHEMSYPITPEDTGGSVYQKASNLTVEQFKYVVSGLTNYKLVGRQQVGKPRYYSKRLPFDGVIDDSLSLEQTERLVRAMNFHPRTPARVPIGDKNLFVGEGQIVDDTYIITRGYIK
jgi:methionyl-tRNA formyltransferase